MDDWKTGIHNRSEILPVFFEKKYLVEARPSLDRTCVVAGGPLRVSGAAKRSDNSVGGDWGTHRSGRTDDTEGGSSSRPPSGEV